MTEIEAERLRELLRFEILDTPTEEAYDSITLIISEICKTPIALISLVDCNRQWFKSKQGLEVCETPRTHSFCRHVIANRGLMIVEDARADPRFCDNPLVLGPPYVRFYAGAPLRTQNGHILGTLCVIDREPRGLSEGQIKALIALARQVVIQIELRGRIKVEAQLRADLESQARVLEAQKAELGRMHGSAMKSKGSLSEFLVTVSHEIRTPLNAIIGFSELLLEAGLNPQEYDYVHSIHKSGITLLETVNDVLDLSKIDAGKMTIEKTAFDLRSIVGDAVELCAASAELKQVPIFIAPFPSSLGMVAGDGHKIRQILLNLLSNAVKFTDVGSVLVQVKIESESPSAIVIQICVADTGTGIAPDQVPFMFQSFTQGGKGIRRTHGGTGLGLAISKQLAELMGGSLKFETVFGRGSKFFLSLSLDKSQYSYSSPSVPSLGLSQLSNLDILLVEDNAVNTELMQAYFELWGCTLTCVADGREALEKTQSKNFDIVFMDLEMPGLSGIQVTKEMRTLELLTNAHTTIIAMTAHALKGDRERCLECGMDDYMTKPVGMKDLRQMLEKWRKLGNSQAI